MLRGLHLREIDFPAGKAPWTHPDFEAIDCKGATSMIQKISISVVAYSCQTFFAAHPDAQLCATSTLASVEKIMHENTVTMLQETHGSAADISTLARLLPEQILLLSCGPMVGAGGVITMIRRDLGQHIQGALRTLHRLCEGPERVP